MPDSYETNKQETPVTSQDSGRPCELQSEIHWRNLYLVAVLETDADKLVARVNSAEAVIRARSALDGEISSEEQTALQKALSALSVLKRERLT
ncbi:MAG TPA: hypothetical protein VNO32_26560 [Candidatus Acidoferrum sp.]|jgi:hypothetical protein|nr:hypothetical protein [Candidatus Acidoferrum sp.]